MTDDRDSQVLGLLCTLQSSFHVLPYAQLAEMIEAGLTQVPGVSSATLGIDAESRLIDQVEQPQVHDPTRRRMQLRTLETLYGHLTLELDAPEAYEPYQPFIKNLVNTVATELESRERAAALARTEEALKEERVHLRRELAHKDEFLAMLGHELRNPLAAIYNAVSVQNAIDLDHDLLDRSRAIIERQTNHMSRLVRDLLDVSRLARGKIPLEKEPLDLRDLVRQTAADYQSSIEEAGLALSVTLPEEPLRMYGDRTRLAQVVGNLLDNATKFTDAPGEIELETFADPHTGQGVICVRDTGIGIEQELLPELFSPFGQGTRSRERRSGGLGLGLALVQGLVEAHGGTIEGLSDGPGTGSAFHIYLTLDDSLAEPDDFLPAPPKAKIQRHFLLVDDERDVADTLAALLELVGHQVTVTYSGPQALEVLKDLRPDVILCDIGLNPPMDGYELAQRLGEMPDLDSSLLVAVTGYGGKAARQRALDAGFAHHMTKPVGLDKIIDLLHLPDLE